VTLTSTAGQAIRAEQAVVDGAVRPATLLLQDGRITGIGDLDLDTGAADVVTLDPSHVLLPGLVDTHVHINEPGRTEWEGFVTATTAAAFGGVTTLLDMPLNSLPPTTTADALRLKRVAAHGKCRVDVGFWGGVVPGNVAELAGLHEAGVFGFKAFLQDSGVRSSRRSARPNCEPPCVNSPRWARCCWCTRRIRRSSPVRPHRPAGATRRSSRPVR